MTVAGTSAQVVEACGRIAGKAQPILQLKIYFLKFSKTQTSNLFFKFSRLAEFSNFHNLCRAARVSRWRSFSDHQR